MTLFDACNAPAFALATPKILPHRAVFQAANVLVKLLEGGRRLDAKALRSAMEAAFGASDADGAWMWKDAYEAAEVAQVLFITKYGAAMRRQAGSTNAFLSMLERLAGLVATQTRRSEDGQALQQFSTPLPLAFVAVEAAGIIGDDLALEPSAGTGMMAVFAQQAGASLALNEYADLRAQLLQRIFDTTAVTTFDAATIHDRLNPEIVPSVVLMNPPFSASPKVEGRYKTATYKHIRSALQRLAPEGRLVTITGGSFGPEGAWREAFEELQSIGRIVFTAGIAGKVYAAHGTTIDTRLTVFDKVPAENAARFKGLHPLVGSAAELLSLVQTACPSRRSQPLAQIRVTAATAAAPIVESLATIRERARAETRELALTQSRHKLDGIESTELSYLPRAWVPSQAALTSSLYEAYEVQSIAIEGSQPHVTQLVQSAAMASVAPPVPSYRPLLPAHLTREGILSDAQLESVIYAGEAHSGFLKGEWSIHPDRGDLVSAPAGEAGFRLRRGWFLGDGTGCGKGRQVAGIVMDNWLKGRRKSIWLSKSDKLIEDARRDWTALGGAASDIVPLSRFKQGSAIRLDAGILFVTYATLRSAERQGKVSRLTQVTDWLGDNFEGVIAFDEAHAMANAAGGTSERGEVKPSQQGKAGLDLQNAVPAARIVYVSATGATEVGNLAYASRLGLWGTGDLPFTSRADFVSSMEAGGIAAMEVISRDLKALGLYLARSVSYEGVEYEMLVHELAPAQREIYDSYAGAFQIIHRNLEAALMASGVTSDEGTLNSQAKSAARSAFESNKQRFFMHLIGAMTCPSLIPAIEADIAAGRSAVIQIVSTNEALMERRLAEIPASDWDDIQVDVTPREYVMDYLVHSFPTQLFEVRSDADGNLYSEPVVDEAGNPVFCREAVEKRDAMIEHLGSLAPVQGLLDQILWHFGIDVVAEVTGRSRRIVRGKDGKLKVQNRPASSNLSETQSFMDDAKRILIFSDAGGTGRSYHADLGARNQRLRVHYLAEPGWRADNAIQGLGRTHRTNQAQPPLFRPVATDVKGQKRFLSTIARRLDTLGAITRGQRQTGGQGMFRPEDNLESNYARAALRRFFYQLHAGRIEACSLCDFMEMTGLELTDRDGTMNEELPTISRFLNRCLALTIDMQDAIFDAFTGILDGIVESAIAGGTFDAGLETLRAESFRIVERNTIYEAPSGARTLALTVEETQRNRPRSLADARECALNTRDARLLVNEQSGRAAVEIPASSLMDEAGGLIERVRLVRPMSTDAMLALEMLASSWKPVDDASFERAWNDEVAAVPEFDRSRRTVVSGLLLPIWDKLPDENMRVYRLQTDDGERVIGRLVSNEELSTVFAKLGLTCTMTLTAEEIADAIMKRHGVVGLVEGITLRRSRVMDAYRLEVVGFDPSHLKHLKQLGCLTEIISWKTRLFVPLASLETLERLIARFPQIGSEAQALAA